VTEIFVTGFISFF